MSARFKRVDDDNHRPTERGTYRQIREYWADHCKWYGIPNTYWAEVRCPRCNKIATLGRNHQVDAAGYVTPTYKCPHLVCTFKAMVVLIDWARPSTRLR